jgi:tight adherence protein B
MFLNHKKKKRIKNFTEELPNAIDVIVRAVKAGLPINDSIRIVASEAKEPVKGEFLYLVEMQQMGFSLAEAVVKLPERMPTSEANFFAIAIVIQQKAGGSISEILGNLSRVLRERKKLKNKVISLSQEAKTSAMIIGSIPILLSGFLVMASPQHMVPLFETKAGNLMLMGCAALMSFGVWVMHKMINIEV